MVFLLDSNRNFDWRNRVPRLSDQRGKVNNGATPQNPISIAAFTCQIDQIFGVEPYGTKGLYLNDGQLSTVQYGVITPEVDKDFGPEVFAIACDGEPGLPVQEGPSNRMRPAHPSISSVRPEFRTCSSQARGSRAPKLVRLLPRSTRLRPSLRRLRHVAIVHFISSIQHLQPARCV